MRHVHVGTLMLYYFCRCATHEQGDEKPIRICVVLSINVLNVMKALALHYISHCYSLVTSYYCYTSWY